MQHINIFTKTRWLVTIILLTTLCIGNMRGDETLQLTNSTIKNNKSGNTSYGSHTIGSNWGGKWLISNSGNTYWLQLGYNTSSTSGANNSHLAITMPSGASSISIAIKTNNNTANGRTFYACNANNKGTVNSGNGDYGKASTSSQNGTATISISGTPSVVYIYPNGTSFIESVTVTYSTASCTATPTIGAASLNGSFFWTTTFCPAWPAKH